MYCKFVSGVTGMYNSLQFFLVMHPSLRFTILICDEEQRTVIQEKLLRLFSQVSLLVFGPALGILANLVV